MNIICLVTKPFIQCGMEGGEGGLGADEEQGEWDASLDIINPVTRLLVLRVINLLWGVEGWLEIVKQAATLLGLAVDQHVIPAQ